MTTTKKEQNLVIVYRLTSSLVKYAKNAKIHTEEHIQELVAIIKEIGWTNPILIDENNEIIAGHGRILAAERLLMLEVPCVTLYGLTDEQKKAYRLADNKLPTNAKWDDGLLKSELSELLSAGMDLSLTGFSLTEVDDLLGVDEVSEIEFDSDESLGVSVQYLSFAGHKIPLTDDEHADLTHALNEYVDATGSFFGFTSHLLGGE